MSSLIRAALMGLVLIGLAGCTSKPLLTPKELLVVGHTYSHEEIKKAILTGAAERGWTVRNIGDEVIQADILVRNMYYARVDITYSLSNYRIDYRDSREMDYRDGKIHRNYNRWVKNLDKSILRALKRIETDRMVQRAVSEQQSSTAH
ncbi:hypothetical protein [Pseudomonas sp. 5P_5.1_Bac1]|uniref:hypothetical protein n=1 Tax=Pseudomonas sp. 5P_5.1_Bac1 TaxID=2971616 RepID=UPI0021C9831C|nr:hypothetical protein [Pseudomonas sp. 5P_5.1_Bac1]MCU1721990.1 hypothetical protein [Pseudomonas sp. 5P_5.1_Bac1]